MRHYTRSNRQGRASTPPLHIVYFDPAHPPTFWSQLHATCWRLYVIFGAPAVPAGCWLMRER